MAEKRKIERRYLIYYLRVFNRNTDEFMGILVDITTEGAMLMSEIPIETNTVFQLKMDLPEEIKGNKKVTFDAMSVRCEKDKNPDFYNTGFQFQKIDQNDVEIIKSLINEFGIENI